MQVIFSSYFQVAQKHHDKLACVSYFAYIVPLFLVASHIAGTCIVFASAATTFLAYRFSAHITVHCERREENRSKPYFLYL